MQQQKHQTPLEKTEVSYQASPLHAVQWAGHQQRTIPDILADTWDPFGTNQRDVISPATGAPNEFMSFPTLFPPAEGSHRDDAPSNAEPPSPLPPAPQSSNTSDPPTNTNLPVPPAQSLPSTSQFRQHGCQPANLSRSIIRPKLPAAPLVQDRRGHPPLQKRWRLYCFRHVFVLEPNVPGLGLQYNAFVQEATLSGTEPSTSSEDPPQLIIFRNSDVIVEVQNSIHQLYKGFGPLDHLFLIDSLVGQLHIADARFLVVVADSEAVAGFNLGSFEPSVSSQTATGNLDAYVYRITKAWLIPFHLSLQHLQLRSSVVPGRAGPVGLIYDESLVLRPSPNPSVLGRQPRESHAQTIDCVSEGVSEPQGWIDVCADTSSANRFPPRSASATHLVENPHAPQPSSGVLAHDVKSRQVTRGFASTKVHESVPAWDGTSFGDWRFSCLLGEKLAGYKQSVERLLSTSFYYSFDIDITHTLQRKRQLGYRFTRQRWPCDFTPASDASDGEQNASSGDTANDSISFMQFADRRFLWNYSLCNPFMAWSIDMRWFTPLMQGSVTSATLTAGIHGLDLVLISRRSCHRAGTRYNHRGIDDAGAVANFNESEQMITVCRVDPSTGTVVNRSPQVAGGGWASFVQVRGSVPLFWEQSGTISINQAPQLTRELEFATQAYMIHQKELQTIYGSVCYVDLLSSARSGEQKLSHLLEQLISRYTEFANENGAKRRDFAIPTPPHYVHWDFHQKIKAVGFEEALTAFRKQLRPTLIANGYYCDRPRWTTEASAQYQSGIIRTNCLDCLDRTNALQWWLAWSWVYDYLTERGLRVFLSAGYRGADPRLVLGGGRVVTRNSSVGRRTVVKPPRTVQLHTEVRHLSQERAHSKPESSHPPFTLEDALSTVSMGGATEVDRVGRALARKGVEAHATQHSIVMKSYGGDESCVTDVYLREAGGLSAPTLATFLNAGDGVDHMHQLPMDDVFFARDYVANVAKDVIARLWADQGDHISRAYTGTGSVLSSLIRQGKSSLSTNVGHMMTSLGRLYQNTFEDNTRQDAIELLLNQHERLSRPYVHHVIGDAELQESNDSAAVKAATNFRDPDGLRSVTAPQRHRDPAHGREKDEHKQTPEHHHQPAGSLRIWFGTWNLGGRRINEPLERWLLPAESEMPVADIYVVAVQELVELTGMRILLSQNDKEKEWKLEYDIKQALGPSFLMLQSHSLVGLYFVIFVRMHLRELISHVHISEVKLGFKGQMGNKGAVLLRLVVGSTSFCFINVHLSPGLDKAQQRRAQLQAVLDAPFTTRPAFLARHHDCVFLGGDFNFRCDVEARQAEKWLDSGNWKDLLYRDQLMTCKRLSIPPFREIYEAPITFPPTYKFRRGTNVFDKGRTPGWCDRVLYTGEYAKSPATQDWIRCVDYQRVEGFLSSDHKPVYGIFQVTVLLSVKLPISHVFPRDISQQRLAVFGASSPVDVDDEEDIKSRPTSSSASSGCIFALSPSQNVNVESRAVTAAPRHSNDTGDDHVHLVEHSAKQQLQLPSDIDPLTNVLTRRPLASSAPAMTDAPSSLPTSLLRLTPRQAGGHQPSSITRHARRTPSSSPTRHKRPGGRSLLDELDQILSGGGVSMSPPPPPPEASGETERSSAHSLPSLLDDS